MQTLAPLQVIEAHPHGVWSICPWPSGRLVSAGGDGLLKSWEVDPGTGRLRFLAEVRTPHTEVLLAHRSRQGTLVSAGHHGGLSVWDLEPTTGGFIPRQRLSLAEDSEEHTDRLLETRSGHLIAWTCLAKAPPRVWAWSEAERAYRFQQVLPIEGVSTLLPLPSGELLSGDEGGRFRSWRLDESTGSWHAGESQQAHEGSLLALTLTQEGLLISAGGQEPQLKVWGWSSEARAWVQQQALPGHRSRILRVLESSSAELLSSDQGSRLLALGWRHKPEIRVWRRGSEGFQLAQRLEGTLRRDLEGGLVVDAPDHSLGLWHKAGGLYEQRIRMEGGRGGRVLAVEPLPSGGLVTGSVDGRLASWDLGSSGRQS